MTSLNPAGTTPAISTTPRIRAGLIGLALVAVVASAAAGSAVGAAIASANARAGADAFIERLEHARRVDDLRNQQLRWAQ